MSLRNDFKVPVSNMWLKEILRNNRRYHVLNIEFQRLLRELEAREYMPQHRIEHYKLAARGVDIPDSPVYDRSQGEKTDNG